MATIIRYVNTASAGGDGTTNGTSGATAAYASIAAWNTAEVTDLAAAGDSHVVICTGGADAVSTTVLMVGWTTGASNTLVIRCDDTLDGTFNAAQYHVASSVGAYSGPFVAIPDYTTLQNIRVKVTSTNGGIVSARGAVYAALNFDRCFFWLAGAGGSCFAQSSTADGSTGIYFKSCVLLSTASATSVGYSGNFANGANIYFYHCTITGFTTGISRSNDDIVIQNSVLFNNGADVGGSGGTLTVTYTASDDTLTGTGNVDFSPGTEATDWAAGVSDYANGDFRVVSLDSPLYQAGSAIGGLTADLIGNTFVTPPTIGAFEWADVLLISTVDSDNSVTSTQTGCAVTGIGFGASQGAGSVKLYDGSVESEQSVVSWSNTSITIDVALGNVRYGSSVLRVTRDDAAYATKAITITPATGKSYITIGTPFADAAVRVTGVADVASGDQVEISNIVGTGDVVMYEDATWDATSTVVSFDTRIHNTLQWGNVATQQV